MLSMESTSSLSGITNGSLKDLKDTHPARVLQIMNNHRKECAKLCDVELIVGDEKFYAHRSVLAACSPYFYAMFNGELIESTQRVVCLKEVQTDVFEPLLNFAYTGNLDVTVENVQPLLALASQINFPEAREICCKFLEMKLDASNCLEIRTFAESNGCMRFVEEVDSFVIDHFSDIVLLEDFVAMPYPLLLKCLASDELTISNEKSVYEAAIKWAKHDMKNRDNLLTSLLQHIRLPRIPVSYLLDEIDNEPLMRACHGRRDMLDEAKNYHLLPEHQMKYRSVRTRPRKSHSGMLFAVGGKETGEAITTKVECYSAKSNRWTPMSPLNIPRHQLGVTELNGRIFAVGGSDGATRLNTVEYFNPNDEDWKYAKSLTTCRSGVGVCTHSGFLYSFGGYDGHICLSSVEKYDPELDIWINIPPMNIVRSFPGVAVLGTRIYVIGGNDGSAFLNSCEVYDPLSNKWSFSAPMNRQRAGLGADVLDGLLYVSGGFDGVSRLDSTEVFDPRTNTWTTVANMVSCRDGLSMRQYGGWLYAIGGIDGPSYLNTVEYYDPKEDKWEEVTKMRSSRTAGGVAVLPYLLD